MLDDEIEQVRILVNTMSVRARDATIKHLVESHILYGKLRRRDLWRFNRLSKKIERYQTNRDMLAHGLWCKFGKSWFVLQVRQTRVVPELRPTLQNLSRATLPQRQKITRAKLRSKLDCTGIFPHLSSLFGAPDRDDAPKFAAGCLVRRRSKADWRS